MSGNQVSWGFVSVTHRSLHNSVIRHTHDISTTSQNFTVSTVLVYYTSADTMGCCFSNDRSDGDQGQSGVSSPLLGHIKTAAPSTGTGTGPVSSARRYRATDAAGQCRLLINFAYYIKTASHDESWRRYVIIFL